MSRVSYRQIRDRFTHIDAEFVRARCEMGGGSSEYVAVLARKLPYVTRDVIYHYIDPIVKYRAPYSLGCFPTSLFRVVREVLLAMGARIFTSEHPIADEEPPVLFLIDDHDHIVADDFELDVPDFEHDDSWFCPELDKRPRE